MRPKDGGALPVTPGQLWDSRYGRGKKGQGNSYARRLATTAGAGTANTDTLDGSGGYFLVSLPASPRYP